MHADIAIRNGLVVTMNPGRDLIEDGTDNLLFKHLFNKGLKRMDLIAGNKESVSECPHKPLCLVPKIILSNKMLQEPRRRRRQQGIEGICKLCACAHMFKRLIFCQNHQLILCSFPQHLVLILVS